MITLRKKKLDTRARDDLPDSAFAIPGTRDYPIHDKPHADNALARASGKPEEAQVKAAVYRKYPELKKSEALEIEVELWKSEKTGKVYGVVLEPNLPDSQDDEVTTEQIEKACHEYMVESRKADTQHNGIVAGAHLIENYIAPMDMELEGEHITKGSWVQAWQITDPVLKQEVDDGKLTGFSIGGSAVRIA